MNATIFLSVVKNNLWKIILWIAVFSGIALFVTWQLPQSYDAGSTATTVKGSTIEQSNVDYYLYDNYYSIQSGAFVADNIVSWLASPPVIANIYRDANVQLPAINFKSLSKIFVAKKQSANSNVVTFTTTNPDARMAERLIGSANDNIKRLVAEINSGQKDKSSNFTISLSEPVVVKTPKPYVLNAVIAGILGLIISLGIIIYTPRGK